MAETNRPRVGFVPEADRSSLMSSGYGLAGGTAELLSSGARALGFDEASDQFLDKAREQAAYAQAYRPDTPTFTEAIESGSPARMGEFALESIKEQVPYLAASILTRNLAGTAARGATLAAGMKRAIANKIVTGSQVIGGAAPWAAGAASETGQRIDQEAPNATPEERSAAVGISSIPQAALEYLPVNRAIGRFTKGMKRSSRVKNAAVNAALSGTEEMVTEGLQNLGQDLTVKALNPQAQPFSLKDTIDAMGAGLTVGGILGGVAGAVAPRFRTTRRFDIGAQDTIEQAKEQGQDPAKALDEYIKQNRQDLDYNDEELAGFRESLLAQPSRDALQREMDTIELGEMLNQPQPSAVTGTLDEQFLPEVRKEVGARFADDAKTIQLDSIELAADLVDNEIDLDALGLTDADLEQVGEEAAFERAKSMLKQAAAENPSPQIDKLLFHLAVAPRALRTDILNEMTRRKTRARQMIEGEQEIFDPDLAQDPDLARQEAENAVEEQLSEETPGSPRIDEGEKYATMSTIGRKRNLITAKDGRFFADKTSLTKEKNKHPNGEVTSLYDYVKLQVTETAREAEKEPDPLARATPQDFQQVLDEELNRQISLMPPNVMASAEKAFSQQSEYSDFREFLAKERLKAVVDRGLPPADPELSLPVERLDGRDGKDALITDPQKSLETKTGHMRIMQDLGRGEKARDLNLEQLRQDMHGLMDWDNSKSTTWNFTRHLAAGIVSVAQTAEAAGRKTNLLNNPAMYKGTITVGGNRIDLGMLFTMAQQAAGIEVSSTKNRVESKVRGKDIASKKEREAAEVRTVAHQLEQKLGRKPTEEEVQAAVTERRAKKKKRAQENIEKGNRKRITKDADDTFSKDDPSEITGAEVEGEVDYEMLAFGSDNPSEGIRGQQSRQELAKKARAEEERKRRPWVTRERALQIKSLKLRLKEAEPEWIFKHTPEVKAMIEELEWLTAIDNIAKMDAFFKEKAKTAEEEMRRIENFSAIIKEQIRELKHVVAQVPAVKRQLKRLKDPAHKRVLDEEINVSQALLQGLRDQYKEMKDRGASEEVLDGIKEDAKSLQDRAKRQLASEATQIGILEKKIRRAELAPKLITRLEATLDKQRQRYKEAGRLKKEQDRISEAQYKKRLAAVRWWGRKDAQAWAKLIKHWKGTVGLTAGLGKYVGPEASQYILPFDGSKLNTLLHETLNTTQERKLQQLLDKYKTLQIPERLTPRLDEAAETLASLKGQQPPRVSRGSEKSVMDDMITGLSMDQSYKQTKQQVVNKEEKARAKQIELNQKYNQAKKGAEALKTGQLSLFEEQVIDGTNSAKYDETKAQAIEYANQRIELEDRLARITFVGKRLKEYSKRKNHIEKLEWRLKQEENKARRGYAKAVKEKFDVALAQFRFNRTYGERPTQEEVAEYKASQEKLMTQRLDPNWKGYESLRELHVKDQTQGTRWDLEQAYQNLAEEYFNTEASPVEADTKAAELRTQYKQLQEEIAEFEKGLKDIDKLEYVNTLFDSSYYTVHSKLYDQITNSPEITETAKKYGFDTAFGFMNEVQYNQIDPTKLPKEVRQAAVKIQQLHAVFDAREQFAKAEVRKHAAEIKKHPRSVEVFMDEVKRAFRPENWNSSKPHRGQKRADLVRNILRNRNNNEWLTKEIGYREARLKKGDVGKGLRPWMEEEIELLKITDPQELIEKIAELTRRHTHDPMFWPVPDYNAAVAARKKAGLQEYPLAPDSVFTRKENIQLNKKHQGVARQWLKDMGIKNTGRVKIIDAARAEEIIRAQGKDPDAYRPRGFKFNNADGTIEIFIAYTKDQSSMIESLAHETGHIIMNEMIGTIDKGMYTDLKGKQVTVEDVVKRLSDPEVRKTASMAEQLIYEHHRVVTSRYNGDSYIRDILENRVARNLMETAGIDDVTINSTNRAEYFLSFDEWFADNVSRWLTTNAKPRSVIESFFEEIANMLRRLFMKVGITGTQKNANAVVARYLKQEYTAKEYAKPEGLRMRFDITREEMRRSLLRLYKFERPPRRPKPRIDSLGAFVTKMGGINRASLNGELENARGVRYGGRPLVRATGGRMLGEVVEAASEQETNYISANDENEFLDAMNRELSGDPVYTPNDAMRQAEYERATDETEMFNESVTPEAESEVAYLLGVATRDELMGLKDLKQLKELHAKLVTEQREAQFVFENRPEEPAFDRAFIKKVHDTLQKMLGEGVGVEGAPNFDPEKTTQYVWLASAFMNNPFSDVTRAGIEMAIEDGRYFTKGELNIIGNASSRGTIKHQLAKLMKDNDAALLKINQNPKVAAAYAFQFWMAGDLTIGTRTESVFEKLIAKLRAIFGIVTNEDATLEIFKKFKEGDMADRLRGNSSDEVLSRVSDTRIQRIFQAAEELSKPMRDLYSTVLSAASEQIDRTGNAHLIALRRAIATRVGSTDEGESMITARLRKIGELDAEFHSIFVDNGVADDREFGERITLIMLGLETAQDAKEKKVEKELRGLLKRAFNYSTAAGVHLTYEGDKYWPRVFDTKLLEANPEGFKAMLMQDKYNDALQELKYGRDEITGELKGRPLVQHEKQVIADAVYNAYMAHNGDAESAADELVREQREGMTEIGKYGAPFSGSAMQRTFGWIEDADLAPYLLRDIELVMTKYFAQMTKKAEFVRRFGTGQKGQAKHHRRSIEDYLNAARETGATEEEIQIAENFVQAALGRLAVDKINPKFQRLQGWAMVVQNYALLGLATITSLVDPLGIAVRGDLDTAMFTFAYGMKEVARAIKKEGKSSQKLFGEMIGTIDRTTTLEALGSQYGGFYVTGKAHEANDLLFKFNGLEGWTNWTRNIATQGAIHFIKKHINDPTSDSERFLSELGLKEGDADVSSETLGVMNNAERAKLYNEEHEIFELKKQIADKMKAIEQEYKGKDEVAMRRAKAKWFGEGEGVVVTERLDELKKKEKVRRERLRRDERLRTAINRWVDEAILRPDASQRPIWGSDPRFMLIMHLKAFTFSFHERILRRVYYEVLRGNYAPVMSLAMYVPAAYAAFMLRGLITDQGDDDDEEATFASAIWEGTERGGLLGTQQFVVNAMLDIQRGGLGVKSFAGPSAGHVLQFGQALWDFDGTADDEIKSVLRGTPGYVIWKDWDWVTGDLYK